LSETKTHLYDVKDLEDFKCASETLAELIISETITEIWTPSIHQIEKWWSQDILRIIGYIMHSIHNIENHYSEKTLNLLKIAFCRVMITHSSASFNHQSMSFRKQNNLSIFNKATDDIKLTWIAAVNDIYRAAQTAIPLSPRVFLCDARQLSTLLPHNYYTCVITSPPYPNRMSYIRELRPYMYWLGYLNDGREAGELDWQAIGGTWGIATSNVGKWFPPTKRSIPHAGFTEIIEKISMKSDILSRYVHKYFY